MRSELKLLSRMMLACLCLAVVAGADAQVRPPTWPDVKLPGGPVRDIILDNCTACHGIDDYAFYAFSREGWSQFLDEKHQGESSVSIPAKDKSLLLDYLAGTFGENSVPFPRNYIPPEITEFFTNADARIFMEVRCIGCHSLDPVFTLRNSEEGWRVLLVGERERGAQLNDEELERLAEWLGRARGINLFE